MPATVSTIRPDRVAIYIRWSTDDQGEGTTLAVQRETCEAYVRSQGWQPAERLVFVDEGISGGTLERPALTRLRALVTAGEVDCVVVYKLDRLSRSVVDMVKLVLDEWEGRCHVKSAREPVDTATQSGKLFFYQLMSFAEWERSTIRERTFAGKLRRAQEGKNPGISSAYGYRLGPDGMPVIEPGEAAVVRLIFRLYRWGMGCGAVARRLGEMGYLSPAGRAAWSSGQVARMLANPIYAGRLVYGKQSVSRGQKRPSERPHLVRDGAVEAIVTPEEWAAVQAARAGRPGVGARGAGATGAGATGAGATVAGTGGGAPPGARSLSSRSLLTGLLRCPCGHASCGNGGAGPRARYRYYYCAGGCGAGRIRQERLDEIIAGALLERRRPEAEAVLTEAGRDLAEERLAARALLAAAERDLRRATERRERLDALLLDGRLTPAEFRPLLRAAEAQAAEAESRLAQARSRLDRAAAATGDARKLLAGLMAGDGCWTALDPPERKRLLRCFVHRIEAFRPVASDVMTCTVVWRLPAPGGTEV